MVLAFNILFNMLNFVSWAVKLIMWAFVLEDLGHTHPGGGGGTSILTVDRIYKSA